MAAACSDHLRSVDQGAQSAAVLPSLPAESSQELDDEGRVEKCVQAAVVREGTEWEACGEWSVWWLWLRGIVRDSWSLTAPLHPGAEPLPSSSAGVRGAAAIPWWLDVVWVKEALG